MSDGDGTELCPDGTRWVCGACGKTSRTRYGWTHPGGDKLVTERACDDGWDSSCMMNAVLCTPEAGKTLEEAKAERRWIVVP